MVQLIKRKRANATTSSDSKALQQTTTRLAQLEMRATLCYQSNDISSANATEFINPLHLLIPTPWGSSAANIPLDSSLRFQH